MSNTQIRFIIIATAIGFIGSCMIISSVPIEKVYTISYLTLMLTGMILLN